MLVLIDFELHIGDIMGVDLKNGIDDVISELDVFRNEANEEAQRHFKTEIELINFIVASLGSLAFATLYKESSPSDNRIIDKEFPATDMWFSNHLTNLVNTILSARDLCVNGFDTQARSLVRMIDERIHQILILFSSPNDYKTWKETEDSAFAHFSLFSKKRSILKKMKRLDEKYLPEIDHLLVKKMREEDERYYSESIHGANVSTIVGSYAYPFGPFDDGTFITTTFGRASSCSFQTLHHIIGKCSYFSFMLYMLLKDVHSLDKIENDEDANNFLEIFKNSIDEILDRSKELLEIGFPNWDANEN